MSQCAFPGKMFVHIFFPSHRPDVFYNQPHIFGTGYSRFNQINGRGPSKGHERAGSIVVLDIERERESFRRQIYDSYEGGAYAAYLSFGKGFTHAREI
jgi:hypothetical protein